MLGLRDINLRNDSDSSVLGILHNLPSLFLSVVSVTFIVAGGELGKAGKSSVNRNTSFYSRTLGTYRTSTESGLELFIWHLKCLTQRGE